ncbi:MAG: glycosyltransferase, partial [Sulfuricurvum sp.]|nr:glycosyltransferase [Sulfuricurvum sp.]
LDLAIKSVEAQWYENWELCIADDKSTQKTTLEYLKTIKNPKIKINYLETNLNISGSSNEALSLASGDYVALMDNDDEITPDALYEVVRTIHKTAAELIYSDEDKLELDGTLSDPHFKSHFAPDMFLSQNYISHLGVIKKELIEKVGGFAIGLEGAQDYDLYLKVLEHTDKVHHISKVLYHWRKIPGSSAADFDDKSYAQEAGLRALKNALKRRAIDADVLNGKHAGTYRVLYKIQKEPLVSIIIPFKDKPELLRMCIESILDKSTYKNFEIIGISNNSSEEATFEEMKRVENLDDRIKFYEYNVAFNYSAINNYAVKTYAKGEQIILLNNDIEIITHDWIEAMLEFSQRDDVGVVGAKLYYPNNTLQHGGVIVGLGGVAGHSHKYFNKDDSGYFHRLNILQNLSAVTAACFMVKKSIYQELNGLNEQNLAVAFNDVDFCLRAREKGYLNIFTPYCEAYHHESISRGHEDTAQKQERFNSEVFFMQERHKTILEKGDPYYNVNLTLDREDFSLKALKK